MSDPLALSAHLPERAVAPGETLVREGEPGGQVWVLVSGALEVRRGGVLVNTVERPGSMIGEVSSLLGSAYGATVTAVAPSVLRVAADGADWMASDAAIVRHVAVGLAERLNHVTAYLADLKQQYGDAPGIAMVSDVLRDLSLRAPATLRPGSARDPEPDGD
ncbi:MAG: cyclic nucleotide-binding domain-containing protein [Rubrivivax sp.]|jgi:CRP-like cAMP-binding protein|nr:cyclic nucleotide-binding domain-containing protein [Rubrivivax sp.]